MLTAANGGSVTAQTLFASLGDLFGNGTITTNGAVLDADLACDAGHRAQQTVAFGTGGSLQLHLDGTGDLGAGYRDRGTLTVADGVTASCSGGYLGYHSGSSGMARVSGPGSRWTNSSTLYVGYDGHGTLNVEAGGQVTSNGGFVGYGSGTNGKATVVGCSSIWTNNSELTVGTTGGPEGVSNGGTGALTIGHGGTVATTGIFIGSQSLLAINVGGDSLLEVNGGTGAIRNYGTMRVCAGADTAAKVYTPVSAGTWNNNDFQAIGGVWDTLGRTFTVSEAALATPDEPTTIDLAETQRILVTDEEDNRRVGVSFAKLIGSSATVTASDIAAGDLVNWAVLPAAQGQEFADAWDMSVSGIAISEANPVYLSIYIGSGYSSDEVHIWHLGASGWAEYVADELTYYGGYANFTATSFSSYLVSVPEPSSTIMLLGIALSALLYLRRKATQARHAST
jgi:T5SS/PEP-CTERM-associated repeat protein